MKDFGGADGECACGRRRSDGRARLRAAWAVARPREGLQEHPVRPIDKIGEGAIGNQPSVMQMTQLLAQRAEYLGVNDFSVNPSHVTFEYDAKLSSKTSTN